MAATTLASDGRPERQSDIGHGDIVTDHCRADIGANRLTLTNQCVMPDVDLPRSHREFAAH